MADREKLQLGRQRQARRARPKPDPDAGRTERIIAWNRRRRAAKKRRLAKLSRPKRVLRRLGVAGTWLLALITVGLVALVALFYSLSNVPRPESLPLPQVATIEYSDGSVLAKIGIQNRTIVSIDQVPEQVRWDVARRRGPELLQRARASRSGARCAPRCPISPAATPKAVPGITQQYAKNAYLSDARTLTRKLKELMIAVKLSREYSKNQILEFYLNTVYFGRGAYGIQAGSRGVLRQGRQQAERGPGRACSPRCCGPRATTTRR